jgi:GNAT superfamily N-acetyltransferase
LFAKTTLYFTVKGCGKTQIMTIEITLLQDDLLDQWLAENERSRGIFHTERLLRFWQEMLDEKRLIFTAWDLGQFLGHVSLQMQSEYPPFRKHAIPEIVDVWVQPEARQQGIGQALLDAAIMQARKRKAPAIGMGVGVTAEYGPAHILYGKNGFSPDGSGLWVEGIQVGELDKIKLGPEAILMWVKPL